MEILLTFTELSKGKYWLSILLQCKFSTNSRKYSTNRAKILTRWQKATTMILCFWVVNASCALKEHQKFFIKILAMEILCDGKNQRVGKRYVEKFCV